MSIFKAAKRSLIKAITLGLVDFERGRGANFRLAIATPADRVNVEPSGEGSRVAVVRGYQRYDGDHTSIEIGHGFSFTRQQGSVLLDVIGVNHVLRASIGRAWTRFGLRVNDRNGETLAVQYKPHRSRHRNSHIRAALLRIGDRRLSISTELLSTESRTTASDFVWDDGHLFVDSWVDASPRAAWDGKPPADESEELGAFTISKAA